MRTQEIFIPERPVETADDADDADDPRSEPEFLPTHEVGFRRSPGRLI
jgi:hypothetical protein